MKNKVEVRKSLLPITGLRPIHSLYWKESEPVFTENNIHVDLFNSDTAKAFGFYKPMLINIEISCDEFK
jgi:hypothetical protein